MEITYMQTKHLIVLILLGLALCDPGRLSAQTVSNANAEFGGRQFNGTLGSSKFTEYRDLPGGLFVTTFSLNFRSDDFTNFFSLWGSNVGQRDQNFMGQLGKRGKWKIEVEWDQIPHDYTTGAKTVFNGAGTGELTMPSLVRNRIRTILTTDLNPAVTGVQFDTAGVTGIILGSAREVAVVSQRDKSKAALNYSLSEEIEFKLQYSNERRSGTKSYGGAFSFNPVELIEPTAYRTQEAKASVEYAAKDWTAQISYSASLFDNNVDVIVWDNPFREVDAVGAGSRGRMDLYPNNTAQNVSFSGAMNLPYATRITATTSYGWRGQNDKFTPFTINRALDTMRTYPVLPAMSLNGKVGTTQINFSVVNRFYSSVWFAARYSSFDYNNQTPSLLFPGYVSTDNSVSTVRRRNLAIGYKRVNAAFDATLRVVSDLSAKLAFEREDWDREHRDAEKTEESIYKASIDYTPLSWFLLRSSFSVGGKKTPHYDAEEVAEGTFPQGEPAGALGQLPQLRKFDLAARDRSRASILTQITPLDNLSFTGSFGLTDDAFTESKYGVLSNKSNNFSLDIAFSPSYDLNLFANYTREDFTYAMKSRQRVPVSGTTPANDAELNDWTSDMKDAVNTF